MSNRLTKDIEYLPSAIPYSPGSAGVPEQPAYYTYETFYRSVSPAAGQSAWNVGTIPSSFYYYWVLKSDGQITQVQVFAQSPTPAAGGGIAATEQVTVPIYHPAVAAIPAVPPVVPTPVPDAWNSGATSISSISADADCTFSAGASNVGTVIGLSGRVSVQYPAITHGLYFHNGVVQPIESGVVQAGATAYVAADAWKIRRRGSAITIYKNGVLYYTSAVPSYGVKLLQASFYSRSDIITDATITDALGTAGGGGGASGGSGQGTSGGSLTGAFLYMHGHIGLALTTVEGLSRPMSGTATAQGHGSVAGVFRKMVGSLLRKDSYGTIAGAFQTLSADIFGGALTPAAFTRMNGIQLPMLGAGSILTGELAQVAGAFRYLDGGLGRPYGHANGAFLPMRGLIAAYPVGDAYMDSYAATIGEMTAATFLVVNVDSTGTATSAFVVDVAVPATMDSTGTVTTDWVLSQIDTALLDSTATIYDLTALGTVLDGLTPGVSVWVLNVDTKASTRYTNFNYNSFASRAGRLYGAKADGIYLLEGDDDDGAEIAASLAVGVTSLPSARDASMVGSLKRVPAAYLGVASDKTMYLKVLANGGEFLYRARSENAALMQQRVDIGRGLRAVYWSFEVYNSEGSDFDLESIEFVPVKLSRRV